MTSLPIGAAPELTPSKVDIKHRPQLAEALEAAQLPTGGIADISAQFFAFRNRQDQCVGYAGFEVYGTNALLRSLVVLPEFRRRGHGAIIVRWMLERATTGGVKSVFLLTTTAVPFFAKLGFHRIERSEAPETIASTTEFSSLCPASAAVMRRDGGA